MNDLEIKRHSFELAKKRLKEFSERTEAEFQIDSVRTDGGFLRLGKYVVKGDDLNPRLATIQRHFIAVNETNNKVIKEFRGIYNALDVLDKDYITSIVANVKAIEKTSNDVRTQQETLKQHNEKLANQQSKLDAHQTEIEKSFANISKIVTALKVFKEKLESYSHLTDIDKIWNDCQKWHNEISSLSSYVSEAVSTGKENAKTISAVKQSLEDIDNKVAQLFNSLSEQIYCIENIMSFMNELQTITHLKDIDEMWDSLERVHSSLKDLRVELDVTMQDVVKSKEDIKKSLDFVETVSKYKHLKDVDAMWDKLEDSGEKLNALTEQSNKTDKEVKKNQDAIVGLTEYKQELSTIVHLKDVDSLCNSTEKHSKQIENLQNQGEESRNLIQHNKEIVDQSLAAEKEKTDAVLQQLNKKIQYAYWIAGGSIALALIELLVALLG